MTLADIAAETKAGLLILCVVCASALFFWYKEPPEKLSSHYTRPPPITTASEIPKDTLKVTQVKVLRKSEATKKLGLPPEISKDPTKEITATADIPATRNGAEVVAVFDTSTGDTTLLAKSKPVPLIAFETEKRLGIGYGLTSRMTQEAAVYADYTFLRAGNIYAGIRGVIDSSPEAKILVTLEYRPDN